MIVLIGVILILLILFGGIVWSVFKHALRITWALILNTVLGLMGIVFLNILGLGIPINHATLVIAALFGLLGTAVLAVLTLLGML